MAEVETSVRGNSHGLDSSDDSNGSSPLPTSVKNSPSDADKLFTHLSSKSYMHNESNDSDLNGNGITQGDPAVSNILFNPVRDGDDDFESDTRGSRMRRRLRKYWDNFLKKLGPEEDMPSETQSIYDGANNTNADEKADVKLNEQEEEEEANLKPMDVVVVESTWGQGKTELSPSESSDDSDPAKSTGNHRIDPSGTSTGGDIETQLPANPEGFWGLCLPLTIIRWRLWPYSLRFFSPQFADEQAERHYRKEIWNQSKTLALWSSFFFILNWVLGCIFAPKPMQLSDKIFFFGIAPVLTLVIPFLVIFDLFLTKPYIYHTFVVFSVWSWSIYQITTMFACGYYTAHTDCGSKDFLSLFYYTSGLQTIALFGLKQNRFPAMSGAVTFVILAASTIVPIRLTWVRNLLNFVVFQAFLLYVHYGKESNQRRLFSLRDQLKTQFKVTQKAKHNEQQAFESKQRLTSYVFHDNLQVRVPLNTAIVAAQNMSATNAICKEQALEFEALIGSLSMMSKVLNDVLDFHRMDSGSLETVTTPFPFHTLMRSMLIPLELATKSRGLKLFTEYDSKIDITARRAAWEYLKANGKHPPECETFEDYLKAYPGEEGIVGGDEMRIRQVVTNLASNACKFTPAGGTLTIRTKLLFPSDDYPELPLQKDTDSPPVQPDASDANPHTELDLERGEHELNAKALDKHNATHHKGLLEMIVIRIEVQDTGYGIKRADLQKGRLFSAFNQTEQGRLQGGKGTGLGLALVRHIVSLSQGRLGVKTKVGEGSTFWVEFPFAVGGKALGASSSSGTTTTQNSDQAAASGERDLFWFGLHDRNALFTSSQKSPGRHVEWSDCVFKNGHKRATSALRGIMDQGGPVELAPTISGYRDHILPTRTIGDPSTGTDVIENGEPSSPQEEGAIDPNAAGREEGTRPRFVELPKNSLFGQLGGPSKSPVAEGDQPLRVLVVDDDQLTRRLMRRMLQRLGCIVSTAENGQVAYEMICDDKRTPASETSPGELGSSVQDLSPIQRDFDGPRYEIILLDNQMPVLSGLELIAKLRELGRTDFVVGVTGNALLSDQEEYYQAGVDHVITKPVFEANLKRVLGIAAERRKKPG